MEPDTPPLAGWLLVFPRWRGLAETRTCAGGLLLRRQASERATEFRRLSRSSFSVNHEGVGSGGVQSLLTAPRRANPGAVAGRGSAKPFYWVASDALAFGRTSHIGC
jgi:hypothetical protein